MSSKTIPDNGYVIIIGAMKCGTSSLYNYLIEHPNICPCIIKEPEYFSSNQTRGHKVEKYEDLWDFDRSIHRYVLEASTGYTKYQLSEPNVPETMYKYGIVPKFIYIVRNPFDRILSHYGHTRYKHSFGRRSQSVIEDRPVEVSSYFLQLEQYRKYFSKEQFLIIDFEDIKTDPQLVLARVFEFLKIPKIQMPDEFSVVNQTINLSRFEMLIKRRPFLRKLYSLIPQCVRDLGKKVLKYYSVPEEVRKLTDQEKKIIYDRLINDMSKFQKEYGFDVRKWGFNV